mgnify:FL=1
MKVSTLDNVIKLIDRYIERGGQAHQINEGVLMHGDWILFDPNGLWKTIIIKEVYVNAWTSKQTVRMYNKTPLKYQKIIDKL